MKIVLVLESERGNHEKDAGNMDIFMVEEQQGGAGSQFQLEGLSDNR